MNLLGKTFVVLIFIMSIVFMTSAMWVYSTHRNWEELAKARQNELTEQKAEYDRLQNQFNRVESELKGQLDAQLQQLRKLETERLTLSERNTSIQARLDQLNQELREAAAMVTATQENIDRIASENATLRTDLVGEQQTADVALQSALEATDDLQQTQNKLEVATERVEGLLSSNANMTTVMRENGINPSTPASAVKPRVDGFVSAVRKRNGSQLVEVTIGSDDGLKPGHTVEVFRKSKYLGRIEILKTSPDRAIGRVDARFQEGRIQEGDRVATRLKLS